MRRQSKGRCGKGGVKDTKEERKFWLEENLTLKYQYDKFVHVILTLTNTITKWFIPSLPESDLTYCLCLCYSISISTLSFCVHLSVWTPTLSLSTLTKTYCEWTCPRNGTVWRWQAVQCTQQIEAPTNFTSLHTETHCLRWPTLS